MGFSLHIHGAAGTVTGSCYRLVTPQDELLIECGMFQGPKSLRSLNYRQFPFDPSAIAATLLTHAHIDHTGLFPKLALAGFRGPAWTTDATRDLLRWLLPDAGAIQESDVDRLNRRNSRRAEPRVTPIYTKADAEASLALLSARRCRGSKPARPPRSATGTTTMPRFCSTCAMPCDTKKTTTGARSF